MMNEVIKETKVVKTKDNVSIEYDHYKKGHENLIVIAHGFYNSKESILLQDLGNTLLDEYDVVIMDFRWAWQEFWFF